MDRKKESKEVIQKLKSLYIKDAKSLKAKLKYMKNNYGYDRKEAKTEKIKKLKNGILEENQINNVINELFNS